MNVAFYLIPKNEVAYIQAHSTMRQVLEKMEFHRYTSLPIINKHGEYVGTLTEGDLLWKIKHTPNLSFHNCEKVRIDEIPRHRENNPIHIDATMEDVIALILEQNFIPVVDDQNIFIGIIRRREIIKYFSTNYMNNKVKETL